ncbi:MAG: TolC family protein [Bacteroidetes bacterium]|nr:TolC family protein [Bacteroidota bacterium]
MKRRKNQTSSRVISYMKNLPLFILLFVSLKGFTQGSTDSVLHLADTLQPYSIEAFYASVIQYHPIVKQSRLLSETARQEVRLARGNFDPKLESRFSNKTLNDKEYYSKWLTTLTIPTWFPIDPKLGLEKNDGSYLNNENFIPASDDYKQVFTGISLPVGKGLFTDDRRAALKQAQLFTQIAEAEQIKLINKILLDAAKDYWQWFYAFYNFRLLDQNTRLSIEILDRVRLNVRLGEASAIDTLQAKITLQQRRIERQEAWLDYTNAGIRVSNYLWNEQEQPIQLSDRTVPYLMEGADALLSIQTLEELKTMAQENHPELKKISAKLLQLDVERKLAVEYLKPRVDLNYTFINQPLTPSGDFRAFQFQQDYKFGFDFSVPVFLRKERAKLSQTKLKIQSTEFEQTQTRRDVLNQVQQAYNQLANTQLIMQQQIAMVEYYDRILKAELLNLENGESDLFKINVQQEKLIQAQSKLLKLRSDYEKLKATLYWAAGVRNLNVNVP